MQIPCNLSLAGTCARPYRHGTSAWQAKAGAAAAAVAAAPELANFAVSTVASRRNARGAREPSPLAGSKVAWRRHCRRLCRATSAKTLNSALFFHTAWVTFSTAELYRRRRQCRRHCRGTKSNYMLLNVDPLQKNLQCRDKA